MLKKYNIKEENGRNARVSHLHPFRHFCWVSLCAIVVILIVTVFGLRNIQDFIIQEAEKDAVSISAALRNTKIGEFIGHNNDSKTPISIPRERFVELDEHMCEFLAPFGIIKIKVFNTNTEIIYSTDHTIIGKLDPDNTKLAKALSGIPISKYESKEDVRDIEGEEHSNMDIVETYVPIYHSDGRVIGSFEIYKDITENLSMGHKIIIQVGGTLSVTVLVVFGVLMFAIRRAEAMINLHTTDLAATNKQLEHQIDERKRTEKELAQVAAQWRTTFDSISDFVTIHDTDFRIVRANIALANALKTKPEDLVGKKCYQVFHGSSETCAICPHGRALETLQPCTTDFFEPHLGIHLEVFVSPVFDTEGKLTGSVHIARDITERKQVEEKLKEHDRLKTEFVINVSHELRTPLAIFKNIISNLKAGVTGKINDKQLKNLEVADKEIDRLARIISDFLDISRIEAGRINLKMQQVRVQSLVSDVVELLRPLADEKNMELTVLMEDAGLFVNVDRDRMVQVLANLINNAVKFVPDCGGKITVRVRELDDEISIAVEDNGPGIEMEDKSKVFDRFVQVEKHVGPGYQGTGLGLAISKELVELHGGRIEVTSEAGCGATFTVFLPLIRECTAV